MRYQLEQTPDGYWVAIDSGGVHWQLGTDAQTAAALIERLHSAHAYRIDKQGAQLWVDWFDGRGYVCEIQHGQGRNLAALAKPAGYPAEGEQDKWEYVIQFLQGPVSADEATLIGYGSEGWELVSVTHETQEHDARAYFKRRIS